MPLLSNHRDFINRVSKLTSILSSKKYSTLIKIEKIIKLAVRAAIKPYGKL